MLLPHLAGRALQLGRWPDGVDKPGWFQANARGAPPWLRTHEIAGKKGQPLRFAVLDEPASLVWAANLGTIELHPYQASIDAPDAPRAMIFDLDPGPGCTLNDCARAALAIRDMLLPLRCFVKTSGAKGLHVHVPLNGGATFAAAKAFARTIAAELAGRHPDSLTDKMARTERNGRVFIDISQNGPGNQTVAPYSLRATYVPLVATPLSWDEVADVRPFRPADVIARIARSADLFAEVLTARQNLPAA